MNSLSPTLIQKLIKGPTTILERHRRKIFSNLKRMLQNNKQLNNKIPFHSHSMLFIMYIIKLLVERCL